ncbi:hypothetical protein HPB50_013064 [Hyalomma asiaticum]|uniref:Uncharacterized protein n=1 Tax=Hyalomma asiaticum TaxID=266040 RepID=A0ACB7SN76_HYAAI|nr:hypothetical protein HPB50_013064 [Hyalomma asiaticum]
MVRRVSATAASTDARSFAADDRSRRLDDRERAVETRRRQLLTAIMALVFCCTKSCDASGRSGVPLYTIPADNRYLTRLLRYDTFALAALRRKVHGYFMRNEMPTAEKLRNDVISDTDMDMPTISTRTMQRMLNDLGFLFRKRKRNSALLERDDIVAWRRKYLRTIREMRRQQRTIYYLDETWVNAGHTKETVWTDTKVMSRQDAFRQGLSTGLRAPSGKGGRLIVLHAGSAEGFVDGAALVFRAKKALVITTQKWMLRVFKNGLLNSCYRTSSHAV